eukprot:m.126736 g.126736  ORF g.126736 m.126736 type:complete len:121 (+) comp17387_c0_seq1:1494-1856(+)
MHTRSPQRTTRTNATCVASLVPCTLRGCSCGLVIQNAKIARDDFVLQEGVGWDVNPFALVRNDDDRAFQCHVAPEVDVTTNREVIKLEKFGDGFKSAQKRVDGFEIGAQLDEWQRWKQTL